jgi:glycosyltransferase involved in cell wall biosynthesis
MNIWILQTGEPLQLDIGNHRGMRAINLSNILISRGHKVTVFSSTFNHTKKNHRFLESQEIDYNEKLRFVLIKTPGYKSNVGLARIWDHIVFAVKLHFYLLKQNEIPNSIFVGFPPIEAAFVMLRWAYKRKLFTMLDLKDRWPEIFVHALPNSIVFLGKFLFYPFYFLRDRCLKYSCHFVTISESYSLWINRVSKYNSPTTVGYLTSNITMSSLEEIYNAEKWLKNSGIDLSHRRRFIFVGSLTRAFDFSLIKDLLDLFSSNNCDIELIICGSGELEEYFRKTFSKYPNVLFLGWIDKPVIDVLSKYSTALVAPYKNTPDFIDSIPNKIIDSFSRGLPVISTLEGEVKYILSTYEVGFFINNLTLIDSFTQLVRIMNHDEDYKQIRNRCIDIYNSKFEFNFVYNNLAKILESGKGV